MTSYKYAFYFSCLLPNWFFCYAKDVSISKKIQTLEQFAFLLINKI